VLNTPASGNLANCTNLPASGVVGVMTVGQGGTGLSTTGTVGQIIGVTAPNTLGYIIQPPASGIAAGAASQVLYQSAPNVTAFVPNGAAGQVLTSNGVAAPSWTNLNAANLSGVLPVANGGTGITSLGAGVQSALGIATNTPGGFVTGPQNTVPPGAVMYFAMNTAPSGWLFCNGASVSTATYANLFAAIGYTYGGSGGSFNIPNLNGQFIRSWDASGAVDPSRVFGSNQNDAYENHTHTATSTDAGHVHQISGTGPNANGGGGGWLVNPQGFLTPTQTGQANITTTVNASTTGGNETRPVNVALYACIKF
jgi:microcystin-dependent protein